MQHVLERLPLGARVVVIRLRSLGDCVLTTPALALLKQHRPDLEIAVVVENRFRRVFEQNPHVQAILSTEIGAVGAFRPGMVLNFHGGTRSQWMTAFSLTRIRAGFGHHSASWLYSEKIPRAQDILGEQRVVHTAEHMASAMFYLGVPRTEIPRASLFVPRAPSREPYAVIHPMASAAAKAWPASRFLEIAKRLKGLTPVFIGGPGEDMQAFQDYQCLVGQPLGDVFSLMQSASLFIGNDSGPAHVAAAFGVPVAVLFGPSNPAIWSPWRTKSAVVYSPEGMASVSVDRLWEAVESLGAAHE